MAVTITILQLINEFSRRVRKDSGTTVKAVSAGYPDILADAENIRNIFGEKILSQLSYREDSAEIIRWHGVQNWLDRIYDAATLFEKIGISLDVVDIVKVRGDEIILDLNEPLDASYQGRYNLVIDTGTCEHCFNIAQAAKNLAELLQTGGYIIQAVPLNCYNHGFYNISPTWIHDFYLHNGFKILFLKAINNAVFSPHLYDVPLVQPFRTAEEKSILLVAAKRVEDKAITWPVQSKYRHFINT
jgi:hypothetical protein